jgi:hypothetical protein
MSIARRLYLPRPVSVRAGPDGVPQALGGVVVEAIREEWVVEEGWWTARPIHRHYYELALADGRDLTVYRDVQNGSWRRQRA